MRSPASPLSRRRQWTPFLLAVSLTAWLLIAPSPASAASECVADDTDDVLAKDGSGPVSQPRNDILAVCVTYSADALQVTVRVAEQSDPETDPVWDQTRTVIGIAVDVDETGPAESAPGTEAGEEFLINLGRFADGDGGVTAPQVRTYIAGTEVLAKDDGGADCIDRYAYDGVRFTLTVPTECLSHHPTDPGIPPTVRVGPFMVYDGPPTTDEGSFDEIPVYPNYLGPYTQAVDPATPAVRLAGPSRTETAIAISQDGYPDPDSAAAAVLARADASPDALAGAPLALAKNGPLLLTNRNSLPDAVRDELLRALPAGATVFLAGGTSAISDTVKDAVEALGFTVERVSGLTRYATSVAIARASTPDPQVIVVADGNSFADALVGGTFAAVRGGVQVLSNGNRLDNDDAVADYLAEHPAAEVIAVGQLASSAVPSARSLAGEDVFATSVAVAAEYADVDGIAVASGTNFPDGLAGGAHAARLGDPLLLSWPDVLPTSVREHLDGPLTEATITRVSVYGGPVALSAQVERDAAAVIG